jgi:ATP-dependent 26S proteasome regulatory subunit
MKCWTPRFSGTTSTCGAFCRTKVVYAHRPGRFDRIVRVTLPDRIGREEILRVHSSECAYASDVRLRYSCRVCHLCSYIGRLQFDESVDLDRVARLTPGLSGADLSFVVNEAAIRTARRLGDCVTADDFLEALKAYYRYVPTLSRCPNTYISHYELQGPRWLRPVLVAALGTSCTASVLKP